jgi:hypothetical protein
MEDIARYIDGTLQDRDVHPRDVTVERVPGTGREETGVWKFDYRISHFGTVGLITISIAATEGS